MKVWILALSLVLLACDPEGGDSSQDTAPPLDTSADSSDTAPSAISVHMDFTRAEGFFSAPFPSNDQLDARGRVQLDAFPNPRNVGFISTVLGMLEDDARGFGRSSAIYFSLSGALDPASLPSMEANARDDALVFLISVDPNALDYGKRYPIDLAFFENGGPFGAPNLLSLLPLQGVPLRESTLYAAVLLEDLGTQAASAPLEAPPELDAMRLGTRPDGMSEVAFESYERALAELQNLGVSVDAIAGLTVFTTGAPTAGLRDLLAFQRSQPLPEFSTPFVLDTVYDDYCVFASSVTLPDYQTGELPFTTKGGGWTRDESGQPVLAREAPSRVFVSVPRSPMPSAGYPLVVFVRTGGGGDRPLMERGVRGEPGGDALEPGSGPAWIMAQAGFAGASVDGPHGGPDRNISRGDEQFLMFNFSNPVALRDNVRQTALETALFAHIVQGARIDPSGCDGVVASEVRFDVSKLGLMGHSMGATVAPIAAAVEPRYKALLLSGAGGSYIANVMHKLSPLEVKPVAELLIGYTVTGRSLHAHDPVLSVLQWAAEGADPPLYAASLIDEAEAGAERHILMMQGIVDTYIMPPIANAASLSMGLDLAGGSLDASHLELTELTPLEALLPWVGRETLSAPVSSNRGTTAVVMQFAEGPIEDGHEVVFQTDEPRHAYRCFLSSWLAGEPTVPARGGLSDPCP